MSVLVDTNVLVYAALADAPWHVKARAFVDSRRRAGSLCVTWSVLYEFLSVVTHPRVMARPITPDAAHGFVFELLAGGGVDVLLETENHAGFLRQVLSLVPPSRGRLYHDVHIASLMLEHAVDTIATADGHFRLFPFLKVIDPTAPR
jgi:toxin-antitoxin system PIN domain toxin